MKKDSLRACPICENHAAELLHTQKFVLSDGHPLANGYDVIACESCGFVYADTAVSQQAYDTFYANSSKYADGKTSTGAGESRWDAERLDATAATVSTLLKDPDKTILDIGCANGGLLDALRRLGHTDLSGVDPAPVCVANTTRRGFAAYAGSLCALPPAMPQFDMVMLSHVLEHIQDLRAALENLRRVLRERALVYVEVPDATRYSDFLYAPFQDFNTEHINHFSTRCLNNLAGQFGLEPVVPCTAKVVKSSPDTLYPAIYSVFQCTNTAGARWTRDYSLRDNILTYISASSNLMHSVNSYLLQSLADCPEIILWGTGQLAMKLLNEEALRKTKIVACVDGNPVNQGRTLAGIPILAPTGLDGFGQPIVITTTLHEGEIRNDIHKLGIKNRVISLQPNEAAGVHL